MKNLCKVVTLVIVLILTINVNHVQASKPEQDGGQWVIYISDKKYSKDSLKWLNKTFKNKSFEINYLHDKSNNEYKILNLKWR